YKIDRKIKYDGEPIKQKWNGLAQHVSAVVLDGTDTIVLTIFSTLANVSIYSVYHLVVYSVKNLFTSATNGIHSLMGELWARQDIEKLKAFFKKVQWVLHTGAVFIFTCTAILIVPFVQVYTKGISDTDYIQPLFAILITAANAAHCLRLPYNIVILAAGEYKKTQNCYIIATVLNIVISIVCVLFWGLIGVAIGTLVAMLYQTVWMAVYNSKHLIKGEIKSFVKQIIVDVLIIGATYAATIWIKMISISYVSWLIMALEVTGICLAVAVIINLIFYWKLIVGLFKSLRARKKNKEEEA
ncbi:MAG: sugar isomerase, partial [Clostridia bacterium]|nr:sugar isomerase [Clostridia bacterium]